MKEVLPNLSRSNIEYKKIESFYRGLFWPLEPLILFSLGGD